MIPALVLAAGKSTRMGQTKALLRLGADTFLSRIVRTFRAAGVEDVVVVVGHDSARVTETLSRLDPLLDLVVSPTSVFAPLSDLFERSVLRSLISRVACVPERAQ